LAVLSGAIAPVFGQDLEPRAYSPNPTGANFAVVTYGHSTGDVVLDTSLPIRDVEAQINSGSVAYSRTLAIGGRSASAALALPYVWGTVEGEVGEELREIRRSGLADLRLRLAVNVLGGTALAPREFAARRPRTTLGASLVFVAPTGQYDPSKLINLGSNRWSFKPELGLSHPRGKWVFELYSGVWLFTDNADFFGGSLREQQPIGTLQAHVGYTFKPRLWAAADATFYKGGRTTVDGVRNDDLQENSRFGLTLSVPLGRRHSVKAAWASGFTTRIGGDFQTLTLAWQYLWFD
jgi:Putative MetA-pathway of phenol degradation